MRRNSTIVASNKPEREGFLIAIQTTMRALFAVVVAIGTAGCATESHQAMQVHQVPSAGTAYTGTQRAPDGGQV